MSSLYPTPSKTQAPNTFQNPQINDISSQHLVDDLAKKRLPTAISDEKCSISDRHIVEIEKSDFSQLKADLVDLKGEVKSLKREGESYNKHSVCKQVVIIIALVCLFEFAFLEFNSLMMGQNQLYFDIKTQQIKK